MKTDPELFAEREEKARKSHTDLVHLESRLKAASEKLGKTVQDSIPPRAAVRIVVPNNWTGWITVGLVVLGLAIAVAVVKSAFN